MRLPAPVRVREDDGWAAFKAFDSVICDLTRRNQPPLPFGISKRRRNLGPMSPNLRPIKETGPLFHPALSGLP